MQSKEDPQRVGSSTESTSTLIGKRRVLARVACRMNRMLLGSRSTQAQRCDHGPLWTSLPVSLVMGSKAMWGEAAWEKQQEVSGCSNVGLMADRGSAWL